MRVQIRTLLFILLGLAAGALAMGGVVLYAGFYNVAATHQHLAPTFWLLKTGLRESDERHARRIEVPPLGDPALKTRGLALYQAQCAPCHGAPGDAPQPIALGLTPVPTNLAYGAKRRSAAELYWMVKNGIKMTGMPAWEYRFSENDLWAVVAFLIDLPQLTPAEYAARAAAARAPAIPSRGADDVRAPGDAKRGKLAIEQYACVTCHRIPGVVGEHAPVGPPLERIATRELIAGVIPNNPENMVRWLREPQKIQPRSAMPDLGVSQRDARDIAAYLNTLR